jgi:hypothetical protein
MIHNLGSGGAEHGEGGGELARDLIDTQDRDAPRTEQLCSLIGRFAKMPIEYIDVIFGGLGCRPILVGGHKYPPGLELLDEIIDGRAVRRREGGSNLLEGRALSLSRNQHLVHDLRGTLSADLDFYAASLDYNAACGFDQLNG